MNHKWIHLKLLETNLPQIGIEGLTDYEVMLWLMEAIRFIKERNHGMKFQEYNERTASSA